MDQVIVTDVNISAINNFNTFNTLKTLLGSMYQVGFSAQTDYTSAINRPGYPLNLGQNSPYLTDSLASQQSRNLEALKLRNTAAPLNSFGLDSVFNQTAATTSNANVVTATTLANATTRVFQIGISQLAQGQTVVGAPADALAPTGVTSANGYGQLEFNINGKVRTVTYQLNGSETNQEAFGAIADQINARDIGITAGVTVNQAGDVSLQLDGPTGAENAFTVTDVFGNASVLTGIGSPAMVSRDAQNSVFTE